MVLWRIVVFTMVASLHHGASYPSRVPSCSVPHPLGHSLLDSPSQTFSNPKGLPVQFNVISQGTNSFRIIMEGDFIKGYLIRPGQPDGGKGNFLVDLLYVTNDFLKSVNRRLMPGSTEESPSSGGGWSVPSSFGPGSLWTTVKEGCVHHNRNFSKGRDPQGDKTYMEFEYSSPEENPTFEAIIVKDFSTWWHKILISKDSEGVYQTKFNI